MNEFKLFLNKLTNLGIPLMWIRDPITKLPSDSLTFLVISFSFIILALISKFTSIVTGIDVQTALSLFYANSALYFGRRLSDSKNNINLDK